MTTKEILNLEGINYGSKQAAMDAIRFITDVCGIRCIESDPYICFVSFNKSVLLSPGRELYSVWIKNSYDSSGKLVFRISLRIDESYSMRIGSFIKERMLDHKDLVLTDEMNDKLNKVMVAS